MVLTLLKSSSTEETVSFVREAMEIGYMEGQKDALSGDIRIEFDVNENEWQWRKSPWDGQSLEDFNNGIMPKE